MSCSWGPRAERLSITWRSGMGWLTSMTGLTTGCQTPPHPPASTAVKKCQGDEHIRRTLSVHVIKVRGDNHNYKNGVWSCFVPHREIGNFWVWRGKVWQIVMWVYHKRRCIASRMWCVHAVMMYRARVDLLVKAGRPFFIFGRVLSNRLTNLQCRHHDWDKIIACMWFNQAFLL